MHNSRLAILTLCAIVMTLSGCGTRTTRPNENQKSDSIQSPLYNEPMPIVYDACVTAARNYFHRVDKENRETWHIVIYDFNFWNGDVKVTINLEPWEDRTLVRLESAPYGLNGNCLFRSRRVVVNYLKYLDDQMRMIEDQKRP